MYTLRLFGNIGTGIALGMALLLGACSYPFDPAVAPEKEGGVDTASTVYNMPTEINGGIQICNPSPGLEGKFSHCMAWLNLGDIDVDKANFDAEYEHDRIVVSNINNGVEWFLLADVLEKSITNPSATLSEPQIQDPEWGSHPLDAASGWRADSATGYIAFLGEDFSQKWDGYIIRMADKKIIRFANNQFVGNETPHVWVKTPPSIAYQENPTAQIDEASSVSDAHGETGWLEDTAKIRSFFGTTEVKIVWSNHQEGIQYIDYTDEAAVKTCNESPTLANAFFDSPLISPDGEWIAYNVTDGEDCRAYVRPLAVDARAILADRPDSVTCDPHWWYDSVNATYSLIYIFGAEQKGPYDIHWGVEDFYKNGITVSRGIGPTIPSGTNLLRSEFFYAGGVHTLIGLPFQGGMNLDKMVVTGYRYANFAEAM